MASIATTHSSLWSSGARQCFSGRFSEGRRPGYKGAVLPHKSNFSGSCDVFYNNHCHKAGKHHVFCCSSLNKNDPIEPEDENSDAESSNPESQPVYGYSFIYTMAA